MSSKMTTGNTTTRISGLEPDANFLPTPPPKAPRSVTLNARDVLRTPYIALLGGLSPEEAAATLLHSHKVPFGSRQRIIRCQVGLTNRWQLPCNLDFDLLGTAQAHKAIRTGFNETLKRIMTEDTRVSGSEDAKPDVLSLPPAVTPLSASHTTRVDFHGKRPSQCLFKSGQQVMAPEPAFVYHAQKVAEGLEPDVVLQCLGTTWELHRPYLIKSGTLSHLLRLALEQQKQEEAALNLTEKKVTGSPNNMLYPPAFKQSHSESSLRKMGGEKVTISLDVKDELVTKVAFSLALRNLYFSEIEVNQEIVVGLLASASVLQFQSLFQTCVVMMKNSVSPANVGKFYYAGHKFRQDALVNVCEQWLELNLVPNLGSQIYLRQLPQELLQKTLKSPRLYTFNEYRLFRTVLYWLFLQQNPKIQMLPAHNTVLSYFNSLSKRGAFLETQVGQRYMPVFQSLRLHGITHSQHLEELSQINVLPQAWLVRVLSNHHHALQNGGDMPLQRDFITQAVRFGLIVDQDRQYFGEIISRYGFYFQLKAVQQEASIYSFYMQRVKPNNPALSFHASERSSFSLRQEREVEYKITTQSMIEGKWKEFSLGPLTHKFGTTNRNHKSKILKACLPNHPIYVTFALLFPPS